MSKSTTNPRQRKQSGTTQLMAAPQPLWKKLLIAGVAVGMAYLATFLFFSSQSQAESDVPVIEEVTAEEDADNFLQRWLDKKAGEYDETLKAKAAALEARERQLDSREDAIMDAEVLTDLKYSRVTAAATGLLECSQIALKEVQDAATASES